MSNQRDARCADDSRTARQFLALFTWTDHETVARGSYYDLHRRIVNVLLPHVTTVEALSLAKVHAG